MIYIAIFLVLGYELSSIQPNFVVVRIISLDLDNFWFSGLIRLGYICIKVLGGSSVELSHILVLEGTYLTCKMLRGDKLKNVDT